MEYNYLSAIIRLWDNFFYQTKLVIKNTHPRKVGEIDYALVIKIIKSNKKILHFTT